MKLNSSYHLDDSNSEYAMSLAKSIKIELDSRGLKYTDVFVEVHYNSDSDLGVEVEIRNGAKNAKTIICEYVDPGAIELERYICEAYLGPSVAQELEDEGVIFPLSREEILKIDNGIHSQLCEQYMLHCTPCTEEGGEFTAQDEEWLVELHKKVA